MARKKIYMVVDTETCTLPLAKEFASAKDKIALAKPLVYDIGWTLCTRSGDIIKERNFLVQETFFVPEIFSTAYYSNKRPLYMDILTHGEIVPACWNDIIDCFIGDAKKADLLAAYNASFDFKKAIPFTERYINALYSPNYNSWERNQKISAAGIAGGQKTSSNPDFLKPFLEIGKQRFPIVDIWGLACQRLLNNKRYKGFCIKNNLVTASGKYFKTSAESAFRYLSSRKTFVEAHTALADARIESYILSRCCQRGKIEPGLWPFPFRNLGMVSEFENN